MRSAPSWWSWLFRARDKDHRAALAEIDAHLRTAEGTEATQPPKRRSRTAQAHRPPNVETWTEALKEAFKPYAVAVKSAFVYGSVAKGTDIAHSDIDLLVIGDDLNYSDLYMTAQDLERKFHRKVSPIFLSPDEWRRKSSQKGTFIQRLSALPKIFIIGSEKDLEAWASESSTILRLPGSSDE